MNCFNNIYSGKTVLITGHTGFKGSWLSTWLSMLGANVIGISIDIPTNPSHFSLHTFKEIDQDFRIDITNLNKVKNILEKYKPDFIFHLAAQSIVSKSYDDPIYTISTNVLGTATLLQALRDWDKKISLILITSDKCYENVEWIWGYKETDKLGGKDPYSASKACSEIVISSFCRTIFNNKENINISSTRAGNVIGGGDWTKDRVVVDSIKSWIEGKPVKLRSPKSTRPWQHVLEPLSGYLHLGACNYTDKTLNHESFNFGPELQNNVTVEKLIIDLGNLMDSKLIPPEKFSVDKINRIKEANLLSLNIDKARSLLNWKPTLNYNKTVKFTADWYSYFYGDNKNIITKKQITDYVNLAKCQNQSWVY